ncbi:MAG: hypothetical protein IPN18_22080 [Ignavibacteriales bacterium]|nr:hypothetical protein [Ignavibacteriales bacterium]
MRVGEECPSSAELAGVRIKLREFQTAEEPGIEMLRFHLCWIYNKKWSVIPMEDELLIEKKTTEGFQLLYIHFKESWCSEDFLHFWHTDSLKSIGYFFSISTNDYGFKILSTQEYELDNEQLMAFAKEIIVEDVLEVTNSTRNGSKRIQRYCSIAGLVFQGYPGSSKKPKQLQASGALLFEVLGKYDPAIY